LFIRNRGRKAGFTPPQNQTKENRRCIFAGKAEKGESVPPVTENKKSGRCKSVEKEEKRWKHTACDKK